MELISDILLMAGSFGETGMGGAIAVLSAQVDDMTVALDKARGAANGSGPKAWRC